MRKDLPTALRIDYNSKMMMVNQRNPGYIMARIPAAASKAAARITRAVALKKDGEPGIPDF
jgi:hypothetical protein